MLQIGGYSDYYSIGVGSIVVDIGDSALITNSVEFAASFFN